MATPLLHELSEPVLAECVERFRGLRGHAPRRGTPFEAYLLGWAHFKRRVAEAAAECLLHLVPAVRRIYYAELSEDYAGRDIDLIVELEPTAQGHAAMEVEETIEAILSKLTEAAGLELRAYTDTPAPFEVHRSDMLEIRPRHLVLLASR